jgi:hypothetical protein
MEGLLGAAPRLSRLRGECFPVKLQALGTPAGYRTQVRGLEHRLTPCQELGGLSGD